jgi:hypothetical protein
MEGKKEHRKDSALDTKDHSGLEIRKKVERSKNRKTAIQ